MKNTLLIATLILSTLTSAQDSLFTSITDTTSLKQERYNPLAPPNTYQNTDNPNYWKNKMPHSVSNVNGLFFVGDSTISYGIGTDSAAHSAVLAHPKISKHLSSI